QNVAQIYQGSGRRLQARAIYQDALTRADALGEWHPTRIQLLNMLASSLQQDGNLLKALSYREKAVAALEAAPAGATPDPVQLRPGSRAAFTGSVSTGNQIMMVRASGSFPAGMVTNNAYIYQQLADLCRQLGRPEAAAKATAKMRGLMKDDPAAL